jgi:type III secretion protein U
VSSDKPFPPSAKKLRDARKRGEIPKSAQVNATAVFAGVLMAMLISLPWVLGELRGLFEGGLQAIAQRRHAIAWLEFGEKAWWTVLAISGPALGACIACAIAGGWSQSRGLISFEAITPKFEKLNPATNLQNIFSLKQSFDLAKKLLEVLLLGGLVLIVLKLSIGNLLQGVYLAPIATAAAGARVLYTLFVAAAVFWIAISALDYGIQWFGFMRNQRMSFDEVKREHKDMEGDPYIKARRRQIHMELARSAAAVRKSKAVVMNPTHVAVALGYEAGHDELPTVLAKALDHEALAMRAEAELLGIAIFEDKKLARALYAEIDVDDAITEPFFEPVAKILTWVEQMGAQQGADKGGSAH